MTCPLVIPAFPPFPPDTAGARVSNPRVPAFVDNAARLALSPWHDEAARMIDAEAALRLSCVLRRAAARKRRSERSRKGWATRRVAA